MRCLSRRPEYLEARVGPGTEVVRGDVSRPRTLRPALEGVETAYYLVHSMGSGGSFVEADRKAAAAFARAARAAGVRGSSISAGWARAIFPSNSPRGRRSAGSCASRVCRRSSSALRS